LYGLGVQGVRVLLLLGDFLHLSKIFHLQTSRCLLPPSVAILDSLGICTLLGMDVSASRI
jgi:hypothetical protein